MLVVDENGEVGQQKAISLTLALLELLLRALMAISAK